MVKRYKVLVPFRLEGVEYAAGDEFTTEETYEINGNIAIGRLVEVPVAMMATRAMTTGTNDALVAPAKRGRGRPRGS